MKSVFLSYAWSERDSDWISRFVAALAERGVKAWADFEQVNPGDRLNTAVESALRASDAIVAVLDEEGSASPSLFFEMGAALGMGKRLIPVVPRNVPSARMPVAIRARLTIVRDDPVTTADRVAAAVAHPHTTARSA